MKRKIFLRCIICAFLLVVLVVGVAEYLQRDISDGIVRLHIIANSDSEDDQRIKIEVRDAVLAAQKEIFPDGIKKELSPQESELLTATAQRVLGEQGVDYGVRVEMGKYYFPTKKYDNITLPAGDYDAVRVVLGQGEGRNWWCVMYPPLCFTESMLGIAEDESKDILKEEMGKFGYEIISEENIKTVPAFKIVEIWQQFKEKLKKFL
ncbi:MAG: stage II sporulation protein R [Clostridia bacterium]|nr:stage II sporulation protein R [Clostridia bacterium]